MTILSHIRYLVVHCSDSADDHFLSATDIHQMHLGFGWDGAGYHKIIERDGVIQQGRPIYWQGAHVQGQNHRSLGVCLVGRNQFTSHQMAALEQVLLEWLALFPQAEIVGHRDIQETSKTCPNFDVREWWKKVNPLSAEQVFIISPKAEIYAKPPAKGENTPLETECLYGEQMAVDSNEIQAGYVSVVSKTDGYQGWVAIEHLGVLPQAIQPSHHVVLPSATVSLQADVKSPSLFQLPLGARCYVLSEEGQFYKISIYSRNSPSQTGFIAQRALKKCNEYVPDWVETATQFMGTPYVWGGKTYQGLDCSALVQACMHASGLSVPRDSMPQLTAFNEAKITDENAFQRFSRSDLVFWNGHVGVMVDTENLLHANAYHHAVCCEPLKDAITRISATFGEPTAHINGAKLKSLFTRI